jgi:hypothetical protein
MNVLVVGVGALEETMDSLFLQVPTFFIRSSKGKQCRLKKLCVKQSKEASLKSYLKVTQK